MVALLVKRRELERQVRQGELNELQAFAEMGFYNVQHAEYRQDDGEWRPLSDYTP